MSDRVTSKTLRRIWYFVEQHGLCCLRRTAGCRARGFRMHLDSPFDKAYATFEHVKPRCRLSKAQRENEAIAKVQLLACQECNLAKSGRDDAPELLPVAELFYAAWLRFSRGAAGGGTWKRGERAEVAAALLAKLEPAGPAR